MERETEFVEVYEVKPGQGRPAYLYKPGALEFLPADRPLPEVGDIILLPRNVTGDSKEQAFAWLGVLTPFRVVEREHLYSRKEGEEHDPLDTKPARHLKSWIFVRRVTQEEYAADLGQIH
jgi:hypothetical protein